jgi:hypothetical protein
MEKSAFDSNDRGEEILSLVRWQLSYGYRYPGSTAHDQFREGLIRRLESRVDRLFLQDFQIHLHGKPAHCVNMIGLLKSKQPRMGPLLLGAHFDTRPWADNEEDPELQKKPILGANDGGSGVAVLLHLLSLLVDLRFCRDIMVTLFDAEDVGGIEGNSFAMGARYLAEHPVPSLPEEVVVLDMVGGDNMIADVDAHIFHYPMSRMLTDKMFGLAAEHGWASFASKKAKRFKYIIADHYPYLVKNIPTCILIDTDYPQWHTHRDLPDAMSAETLVMAEDLLRSYLSRFILP